MKTFPIMSPDDFQAKYPELHDEVCDRLGMGFVPNIFRCLALANPDLALASWTMVKNNLCSGVIPRATKEILFSYIAYRRNCEYCHVAHHALAVHHGFTEESILGIIKDIHSVQNPMLKAVLQFADLTLENRFHEISEHYAKFDAFGFDDIELTELIGIVSCSIYMVNIADSLLVDVDQKFIDTAAQAA